MNQSNKDLINYIESIPYGSVIIQVRRENRKTKALLTSGEETVKYEKTQTKEAQDDINNMVDDLVKSGYTGEAHVKLTMNDGNIKLLSIFNKKETKY